MTSKNGTHVVLIITGNPYFLNATYVVLTLSYATIREYIFGGDLYIYRYILYSNFFLIEYLI